MVVVETVGGQVHTFIHADVREGQGWLTVEHLHGTEHFNVEQIVRWAYRKVASSKRPGRAVRMKGDA